MIGLPVIANLFTTVIALAVLSFVLCFQFGFGERAGNILAFSLSVMRSFPHKFRVVFTKRLISSLCAFLIGGIPPVSAFPILVFCAISFGFPSIRIVATPSAIASTFSLSVAIRPGKCPKSVAFFAQGLNAVRAWLVFDKLASRKPILANYADFANWQGFINHSVSLSLYLRWLSADGEIFRRSGATLADMRIIP